MKKNTLFKRKNTLILFTMGFLLVFLVQYPTQEPVIGMDFVGGVKMEYKTELQSEELVSRIKSAFPVSSTVVFTEDTIVVKVTKTEMGEEKLRETVGGVLDGMGIKHTLVAFDNISPKFGSELKNNSIISIVLSFLVILFYIFYRYELTFALSAILTLVHDVLVVFVLLLTFSIEINTTTIAAILTLIGYSLNDTIILFDRVRDILRKNMAEKELSSIINIGIKNNLSRMFLTSLTTLFAVGALVLFGGEELHSFSITLFFGIIVGTYSSVFLSSTLIEVMGFSVENYRYKYKKLMERRKEKERLRNQFSQI